MPVAFFSFRGCAPKTAFRSGTGEHTKPFRCRDAWLARDTSPPRGDGCPDSRHPFGIALECGGRPEKNRGRALRYRLLNPDSLLMQLLDLEGAKQKTSFSDVQRLGMPWRTLQNVFSKFCTPGATDVHAVSRDPTILKRGKRSHLKFCTELNSRLSGLNTVNSTSHAGAHPKIVPLS